jgi:hypothetical protein
MFHVEHRVAGITPTAGWPTARPPLFHVKHWVLGVMMLHAACFRFRRSLDWGYIPRSPLQLQVSWLE